MATALEPNKGALAVAAAYRRRLGKRLVQPKQVDGQWPRLALGMGLEVQLIWLTPELATHWLAYKPQVQRNINKKHTEMIERAIVSGEYKLNGEPIIINKDGHLSNGQHRCQAVINTRKKILTVVIYEIPAEAFDTMDNTRVRTGGSAIAARGGKYSTTLDAMSKLVYRWENKTPLDSNSVKLSSREIDKIALAHPEFEAAVEGSRGCWKFCRTQSIPSFCYWVLAKIDQTQCDAFFEKFASGEGLIKGDPLLELRRKISERKVTRDSREDFTVLIHWIFKSWNAMRKGEKINQLRIGDNEEMPRPI